MIRGSPGICIGFPLMVVAIGFGLGAVFTNYPYIHQGIKIVGVIYLLFLAWKIANAANPKASGNIRSPLTFLQAAAFQWVNPKAWLIAIGAIATFTSQENMMRNMAFIVFAYLVTGFICMGFWLGAGASLMRLLEHDKHRRFFNTAMAALLVLSIMPMVVSEFGL